MPAQEAAGMKRDGETARASLAQSVPRGLSGPPASVEDQPEDTVIVTDRLKATAHALMATYYLGTLERGRALTFEECCEHLAQAGSRTSNHSATLNAMEKDGLVDAALDGKDRLRYPRVEHLVVHYRKGGKGALVQTWPVPPAKADAEPPAPKPARQRSKKAAEPMPPPAEVRGADLPTSDLLSADTPTLSVGGPKSAQAYEVFLDLARTHGHRELLPTELMSAIDGLVGFPAGTISIFEQLGFLRFTGGRKKSHTDPARRVVVFRPYTVTGAGDPIIPPECQHATPTDSGEEEMVFKTKAELEAERDGLVRARDEQVQAAATATEMHEANVREQTEKVAALREQLAQAETALSELTASPPAPPETSELDQQIASLDGVINQYDQFMRVVQR